MKPWIKYFILLAALNVMLITPGCKPAIQLRYGMKQPSEETPLTLMTFLEKHEFPVNDQYIVSDSMSFFKLLKNQTFNRRMLSYFIFNPEGDLLRRDTSKCQWATYIEIATLNPDSSYLAESGLKAGDILEHITPLVTTDSIPVARSDYDFIVVVTWAKYLGKYNHRLFGFHHALNTNKTASIRWIWLNCDMQQSWNLSEETKISIR